ncbi:MAG TPA: sugar ABC transporter permease [Armatimonadota bacterium]|nr:sugar ABC transporter permease [Armatimonadota bacterium]
MKGHSRRELLTGLAFISPWIIGFSVFMAYPIAMSGYYSFCDYNVLTRPVWIGARNYIDLVRHDPLFWTSLENTFYYAALALPFGMILALALALLLNAKVRGMTIYRTIFFVPSLVPAVALGILWLWIFNGDYGLLNEFLKFCHVPQPQWLSDPTWSKPALVLTGLWTVGNAMVIYLAGLQDVPQTLYEAAELDGAGWWGKTWHVTLPMLSPVILFNLIMGIIGTLQIFTLPYVMFPGGSPVHSTYFYTMYLYDNAFVYLKMGYACAMGWIMFFMILGLTMLAVRLSSRRVYYGGS